MSHLVFHRFPPFLLCCLRINCSQKLANKIANIRIVPRTRVILVRGKLTHPWLYQKINSIEPGESCILSTWFWRRTQGARPEWSAADSPTRAITCRHFKMFLDAYKLFEASFPPSSTFPSYITSLNLLTKQISFFKKDLKSIWAITSI